MKLTLDKKQENRIEFLADGLSMTLVNVIRRYSMSYVPVLAIDTVVFYDNTSSFWDEYIAHRLGMIPITTPDKMPKNTEVVLTLDAEGPKTVYSSEIQSSDKDITIAKEKIIVATLAQNQRLRFECKTAVGIGRKHGKYQAGIVSYGEEGKSLRIRVESFYQMQPSEVLERGIGVLESHIEEIEEALGEKKPAKKKKEKEE